MFTKKRIIRFFLAVAVFLAVDVWMYSNLTNSFRSYIDKRNFNEVELFAKTTPDDPNTFGTWLSGVGEVITGARAYYFQFNEKTGTFDPVSGSPLVSTLYQQNSSQAEFNKAFESAYYLEPMRFSHDGGTRFILRNMKLPQTISRTAGQPPHVIGDLHQVTCESLERAMRSSK